jgi:DNA-binding MarR family transcriptional regulator
MSRRLTAMTKLASSSSAELAVAVRGAVMKLARRLRSERADETLGLSPLFALSTIELHEPLSASALAQFERLQPSSLTRVIATLEDRGFIERQRNPDDARQTLLTTTQAGRDIVHAERQRRQEWLAHMIDSLTDEEREQLRVALPILRRLGSEDHPA